MSFLTPQQPLMAGMTMPSEVINYQQPTGLMDRFTSFAQNNPNQLALALGMMGEAFNPTPTARAVTQTARGKIMSDRADQARRTQEEKNNTYMKMLADAMSGKFTEDGVAGPTKLGITSDGKGDQLNLKFNGSNLGDLRQGLTGLMSGNETPLTQTGAAINPPGPQGGWGAGLTGQPAYNRPLVGGASVNPQWPRL